MEPSPSNLDSWGSVRIPRAVFTVPGSNARTRFDWAKIMNTVSIDSASSYANALGRFRHGCLRRHNRTDDGGRPQLTSIRFVVSLDPGRLVRGILNEQVAEPAAIQRVGILRHTHPGR